MFCSTKHLLYVSFTTLKRTAQVFNRGFFGLYDFSDEYVKLGHTQVENHLSSEITQLDFYNFSDEYVKLGQAQVGNHWNCSQIRQLDLYDFSHESVKLKIKIFLQKWDAVKSNRKTPKLKPPFVQTSSRTLTLSTFEGLSVIKRFWAGKHQFKFDHIVITIVAASTFSSILTCWSNPNK